METESQPSGLPCPECRFVIPVSIEMILSGEEIVCPKCGLKLTVDPEQSKASLALLRKVQDKIDDLEREKNRWK